MMLHHSGITRIAAAILIFAVFTQLTESALVNCAPITTSRAAGQHSGMIHHQQHGSDALSVTAHIGGSDHERPGTNRCNQTLLCGNVTAMPTIAERGIQIDRAKPTVSLLAGVLEGRVLRPEQPPPRI